MPACTRPNGFKASFIQNLLLKDLDKTLRDNQLSLDLVFKLEMLLLNVENMLPEHQAFDAKRIIKWTPNRCPNLSNTLVKPGSEQNHEKNQKSCFSDVQKYVISYKK